jgi:hypothetical protein
MLLWAISLDLGLKLANRERSSSSVTSELNRYASLFRRAFRFR